MTWLEIFLLGLLIVCAITSVVTRRLISSVIVYMVYSIVMAILWFMLESPDLAITEAAVGAGITSILLFVCLRSINALKGMDEDETDEKS